MHHWTCSALLRYRISDFFRILLVELASDLMHSRPDLAIKLVERARPPAQGSTQSDWALARLSIELAGQKNKPTHRETAAEDIASRIKDPAALRFSQTISVIVGKYSPTEVLREAEKLHAHTDRLFLLQEWADSTREPSKAAEVIDYALKLAIRSTEFTPHASHLRKLATPLPFLTDREQVRALMGTFDAQKATIEKLGPTEDYVRLQLILTQAEAILDAESATRRLLEVYFYIIELRDLETKTICLARLVDALPDIDPSRTLSDTNDVSNTAEGELKSSIETLLSATADHSLVAKNIIAALSANRADLAFPIAASLNVEDRRDEARLDLFEHALRQRAAKIPLALLSQSVSQFCDPEIRDQAIRKVLERVARAKPETIAGIIDGVVPFIERILAIEDPGERYLANCSALTIIAAADPNRFATLSETTEKDLLQTWESMELGADKVEAGFSIASSLAPTHRRLATSYLQMADALRRTSSLDYDLDSYVACLRLATRAYAGLLPKKFENDTDLDRLTSQIELVHSDRARIMLWAELALRCFQHDRTGQGRRIVTERIKPNLDAIAKRSQFEWRSSVALCAPALYSNHKASTLELVKRLDASNRDTALYRIITSIFRKIPLNEPYETRDDGPFPDISYEDALDICELLQDLGPDISCYVTIFHLVESLIWRHSQKPLTTQQKTEIAQKLSVFAEHKFPTPHYIAHDGFKIIANAEIAKLSRQRPVPWEHLVTGARLIPNLSDRVFVLARIAGALTEADIVQRGVLLREVKIMADSIPSILDRVNRFEILADEAKEVDLALCKQCIRDAISSSAKVDDPEVESLRRRMVDFAHRIDPELASSLASSFDDDEARIQARKRIELREMRKKIAEGKEDVLPAELEARTIAQEFWTLLGQLNGGRIEPLSVTDTRRYVETASNFPLYTAYPILAWVLENAIQKRGQADESRKLLRGFFDAALIGCELSQMLRGRAADKVRDFARYTTNASSEASVLIQSGRREVALQVIRDWLAKSAVSYLKICDPYFGPEDLEALQLVLGSVPSLEVSILTSKKHQENYREGGGSIEEIYTNRWRKLSDQAPPKTEIVIVGDAVGALPIHERWWLTKGSGLKIGTSFNSLGGKRESEISLMTEKESEQREREVDDYLTFRKREHQGRRLNVHSFVISAVAGM